jgi:HK97 family phage prohead protease
MNKNNLEVRNNGIVIERSYDDSRHVEGYAVVFESQSEDLGFFETIDRGAITQELVDNSDVFALLNHDDEKVLARSKNGVGSLKLTVDDRGLKYEFDAAETQLGNDLLEYLKRGEITTSSFAFALDYNDPEAETWERKNGANYRTIHKIAYLHDVSPVWNAAYSATSVSQRSLDKCKELEEKEEQEKRAEKEEHDKAILESLDAKLSEIESIKQEFGV